MSNIDTLICYTDEIIKRIYSSHDIMRLVSDDPDYDIDSPSAQKWEEHVTDYNYVDETTEKSGAYICVDVNVYNGDTKFVGVELNVYVICTKSFMRFNKAKFGRKIGNRRDNIMSEVDKLLSGAREFGIGRLTLTSVEPINVPDGFTGKVMTYKVTDFERNKPWMLTQR